MQIFKLIVCIFCFVLLSCNSYKSVRIPYRLNLASRPSGKSSLIFKSQTSSKKKIIKYYKTKYYVVISGSSHLAELNNRAIIYGLQREFAESLALFEQALLEKNEQAILYNNLGLVYELMNDYERAFDQYSKAALLEPGNKYFQSNFLLLDK